MPLIPRAALLAIVSATLFALPLKAADTASAPAASPEQDVEELQEVVVFARGEQQIGLAAAASEGAVGGADLSVRPLLRVAELL